MAARSISTEKAEDRGTLIEWFKEAWAQALLRMGTAEEESAKAHRERIEALWKRIARIEQRMEAIRLARG
jgi:hypothetical protein